MPANYLHGVETINVDSASSTVRVVKAAAVALIGIAPEGASQALTLCLNEKDDAQFGVAKTGFNIPQTLKILRKEAGGFPVIVINVFDSATHTAQVTDEAHAITNGKVKLTYQPVGAVTIKKNDGTASGLVLNTDYKLDEYGNFVALSTNATEGTTFKFSYKKLDLTTINAATLVGGTSGGVRTGCALLSECFSTFGYNPKFLITPEFSTLSGVIAELRSKAQSLRARFLQDAPYGTTPSGAISGRGISGSIGFNTSDERTKLCYPYLKLYNVGTDSNIDYPMSAFLTGVWVRTILDNGYWYSPSNKEVLSAVGVERVITSSVNDASTEANSLNEVGITTYFTNFGSGIKIWGQRNASFPNVSTPRTFDNFLMTDDIVAESLEQYAAARLGQPITQAWIDNVRQEANNFVNSLIKRGALLQGSRIEYNKADNPPADVANGQIKFRRVYMSPVSAERITFYTKIDINLLSKLN